MITTQQFIEILKIALGNAPEGSASVDLSDGSIYDMARNQGVVGLLYDAVSAMPPGLQPSKNCMDEWRLLVRYVEQENKKLNHTSAFACQIFRRDGFKACVLKGQGSASMYPNPLRRAIGDVDIWVDADAKAVDAYMRKNFQSVEAGGSQHVSTVLRNGVTMEVHFSVGAFSTPWYNRMFQKWVREQSRFQWENDVELVGEEAHAYIPTVLFNSVYLIVHFMCHFGAEGAGMKQLLDYYWLMYNTPSPLDEVPKKLLDVVKPMIGAMSWTFLQMGMPEDKLWVSPDEKLGRLLLEEIMRTGIVSCEEIKTGKYHRSPINMFFHRLQRGFRLRKLIRAEWYCRPLAKASFVGRYIKNQP